MADAEADGSLIITVTLVQLYELLRRLQNSRLIITVASPVNSYGIPVVTVGTGTQPQLKVIFISDLTTPQQVADVIVQARFKEGAPAEVVRELNRVVFSPYRLRLSWANHRYQTCVAVYD